MQLLAIGSAIENKPGFVELESNNYGEGMDRYADNAEKVNKNV